MNHPLVSIGLLSYNREKLIGRAIKSLLAQSYPNIEIIISDDASVDASSTIGKKYAKKYPNIYFYQQKKNLGIPGNSNFVLSKAKGEFFMWASNDDTWSKYYIQDLVQLLTKYSAASLAASNLILSKGARTQSSHLHFLEYSSGPNLIKEYLRKPSLLVWGVFRTKILKKAGGFHEDGRPLYGGSDHVTVFNILLLGGLATTQKKLFYKADSGYALDRFEQISHHLLSWVLMKRIVRYLSYPLLFSYDLYYLLSSTLRSQFSIMSKITTCFWCIYWYIRVTFEVVTQTMIGIYFVVGSLLKNQPSILQRQKK
ncbi:MAG: glycosyltransferase family 2 protein [bacterium]|nr:glycosyltransferase family 2 protein [bacterium]